MNIQDILTILGKNATVELADVINLIEGQPVSVPVQPASIAVGGKSLVVSLQAGAVQLQLH